MFLTVLDPGARTVLQDTGFRGGLAMGVPASGVMDRESLMLVNALVGNPPGTEALEIALTGPRLRVEGGALRIAISGGLAGQITRADGRGEALPPWTATTLEAGEDIRLTLTAPSQCQLLAIGGGVAVPRFLGSRSTLAGAGVGGFQGRALQAGDRLPVTETSQRGGLMLTPPQASGPIRLVAGPQAGHFTDAAYAALTGGDYTVTAQTDRMGMRLQGAALDHSPLGADIISDGIAPGAIQVPGNGQPIVLLGEAQTTGGYAKIATVISADLPRLSRLMPGDRLRFALVSPEQAVAAARAQAEALAAAIAALRGVGLDPARLLAENLIGGAVDAACPDHFHAALKG